MKKLLFALFSVTLISSLQSCKEDIELIGDFKETPVIYGLLDQADEYHMIKITRAFIGPGNANEFAQIPDSSYFENLVATITEKVNGNETNQWTLQDTIIDNKDPNGVFYAPYQKLYYFKSDSVGEQYGKAYYLNPNATYELMVNINDGEIVVTGQTELVKGVSTSFGSATQRFRFIDNQGFKSTNISLTTGNARVINSSLNVEFSEWRGLDTTKIDFDWGIGESEVNANGSTVFLARGETFFNKIVDNCTNDPAITKRTLNGIRITIISGSEDLNNYININQPSSSLAQNKPTFTNLEVTNGFEVIGLFSSRSTIEIYKPFRDLSTPPNDLIRCIDFLTTEHLCTGGVSPFSFCSDHPADNGEFWACN